MRLPASSQTTSSTIRRTAHWARPDGLSGICKRWEKVYYTPVSIEETHKDGVDRTVLTLSTGGHEQDVQAMLELYSDLIDPTDPQSNQETIQAPPQSDQKSRHTTQKTPPTTQKSDRIGDETTQKTPSTTQKTETQSLSTQEKIIQELKKNPNLSRKQLAQLIPGISEDGIKYHLNKLQENSIIRRVGPAKGGYWEVLVKG